MNNQNEFQATQKMDEIMSVFQKYPTPTFSQIPLITNEITKILNGIYESGFNAGIEASKNIDGLNNNLK